MVAVRPSERRRLRAPRLSWKASSSAACWTRADIAGDTPASRFSTRETVLRLTPARAATSRIVARGVGGRGDGKGFITMTSPGNKCLTAP